MGLTGHGSWFMVTLEGLIVIKSAARLRGSCNLLVVQDSVARSEVLL